MSVSWISQIGAMMTGFSGFAPPPVLVRSPVAETARLGGVAPGETNPQMQQYTFDLGIPGEAIPVITPPPLRKAVNPYQELLKNKHAGPSYFELVPGVFRNHYFSSFSKLIPLKARLNPEEYSALMKHVTEDPQGADILEEILNVDPGEQVQRVHILIQPGQRVVLELELGEGFTPADRVEIAVETITSQNHADKCPSNSVFVSLTGLCYEKSEHTVPGTHMPQVNVTQMEAESICSDMQEGGLNWRLPTEHEWKVAASKGFTFDYATRKGTIGRGVHYNAKFARPVCEASGDYIEYDGKEICDMSGNVAEWVNSTFYFHSTGNILRHFVGGSWDDGAVKANDSRKYYSNDEHSAKVGFRCVAWAKTRS